MREQVENYHRFSMRQKIAKDYQWYKDRADELDKRGRYSNSYATGTVSDYQRMKVNYDLFNNRLNLKDFEYVCQPYGASVGELPAQMVNRDIVSGKIKALLGMELRIPFTWRVFAVNPEATTRKEQKTFELIREYVISRIMEELKKAEAANAPSMKEASINSEPPPMQDSPEMMKEGISTQESKNVSAQIPEESGTPPQDPLAGIRNQAQAQAIESPASSAMASQATPPSSGMPPNEEAPAEEESVKTPKEVLRYMEREYQDPAEILAHQLLEYLIQKCSIKNKFSTGFKHLCLSAKEVFYLGIFNGEPDIWNVNSMRFNCDMSPDNYRIEDGEWATCEYRMSISEVIKYFGEYLTEKEIDKIYGAISLSNTQIEQEMLFAEEDYKENENYGTIRVLHCVWKSLRKIKFLTYSDEEGEIQQTIVEENYRFNEDSGDINLEEQWIPEVYETWKIGTDIYVKMQPVPGQFKDLDNLYKCKLPYYGAVCDNMNSDPVSIMDRLKAYQYYYNIVMYRLEMMLASDKGKKALMNINAIPKSSGIDIEKWQYFFESTPFMWVDPNEEGVGYNDINTLAKQIDLSLASDISKYIELAEYLRRQAGLAIGVTERMEGEVGNRESVANYTQSLQQSSNILEPYFTLHSQVKRNVLEALLELAKIAYSTYKPEKLVYILDDFSQKIIDLDTELLDNSTYGIFVSDSFKIEETKQMIQQLAHAALQNQQVDLADVIEVLRQDSATEAEEVLRTRQKQRQEELQKAQQQQQQAIEKEKEQEREFKREEHKMKMEEIKLKEEERRKTEVAKMSLTGASFNPTLDSDKDGENDFIEIASQVDQTIKLEDIRNKHALKEKELEQKQQIDMEKLALEEKKLEIERKKLELENLKRKNQQE